MKQTFSIRFAVVVLASTALALVACEESESGGSSTPISTETHKLVASDGTANDSYGLSLSIDADVAVIGAYTDKTGGITGAVYVNRFDGVNWNETVKLVPVSVFSDDLFGYSVSISGDVAAIGDPGDDMSFFGESDEGAAYAFRFDGANWVQTRILPSDRGAGDLFGTSVCVDGDVMVVGAGRDDDNGSQSGSAYVYRYNGASWVQEAKLLASDGAADDQFGDSVSVDGDVIVVGARRHDENGPGVGAAYVYRFDGANWVETKLVASDGAAGDQFGSAVAVDADVVAVGAVFADQSGADSGSVYVYRYDGANWVAEQKLAASDGAANDWLGDSVSVDGDVIIAGAPLQDASASKSGAAYAYRFDGASWVEEAKLGASDGGANDVFGISVSVDGNTVMAGAPSADGNEIGSGAAYVFGL